MIIRINVLLVLFLLFVLEAFTQGRGNNWVFGDSAGISFTTGQPVPFSSAISSQELCSSISDEQGTLLFYNGGFDAGGSLCCTNVWDRNNQLMPNGTQLVSSFTVTQGSIILPVPYDPLKYDIFNVGIDQASGYKLYYSTVDMSLNNGNGDINQKNILLCDSSITEKMCAVKHGNGRDWWLILHKLNSDEFYKYIVTPNAILGPYIQSIGDSINFYDAGQMILNEQGTKLAFDNINAILDIFDFDRCNGLLSNPSSIGGLLTVPFSKQYYGCSFSPNDNVFYASTGDSLFQFDLTASNIQASKTFLFGYDASFINPKNFGQHLLGPDRKIYVVLSDYGANYCDSLITHLSVINNPNTIGLGCNFSPYSIALANCSAVRSGLPNMPNYNLGRMIGSVCDTVTGVEEAGISRTCAKVYPNPAKDICTVAAKEYVNAALTLYDAMGRKMMEQKFNEKKIINMSTLAVGIYFVRIEDESGNSINQKIVKE